MKQRIDKDQEFTMAHILPASPRDDKIKAFGIATFIFYALAGLCAWQFGGWWGLALVVCMFIIDTLDQTTQEEYREELIELHGLLVCEIAENSDILDNVIPTEQVNQK